MNKTNYEFQDVPDEAQPLLQEAVKEFFNTVQFPIANLIRGVGGIVDKGLLCRDTIPGIVSHMLFVAAAKATYSYFKVSPRANGLLDDTKLDVKAIEQVVLDAINMVMSAVEEQAEANLEAGIARKDPTRN